MRMWLKVIFIVAGVTLACVVGTSIRSRAQIQRPVEQQNSDKIVISKDEVPFDVVVRDKKGRPINDLTVSDFEVYEDGVRQEINSFRFVSSTAEDTSSTLTKEDRSGSGNKPSVTAKKDSDRPEASVSAVALVFDRLSPESRPRAREAALSYLGESVKKSELVGVFLTDLSVVFLQPFTNDSQLIKAGIEKAGVHASSLYTSNNEQARVARAAAAHGLLKAQGGAGAPPEPGTAIDGARAAMVLGDLEWLEETQRDQQGNATAHGLLHIASSLRAIPGRKAVIFFSEGLVLPPNVYEAFRSVINEANRNNVSFYAIDVAGLRTDSKTAETRREINSRSDLRMAQLGSTSDPQGPMTKGLERNEDLLRLNPDSGLGQLANETGGFLITDSNDLKNRIQQVDEDLHSYYLLSYSSNNQKYDGHFRKIEVKLKRSGLSVQSRKGYYAIKGTFASPVLSYEAPVLAALDNTPKADSFPFYVGGFSFPDRPRIALASLMADVPMSAFTIHLDQAKKSYDTDFSIVMLVKNQAGEVVAKLSNQYRLNGSLDKAEDAKKGRVLFYREANLRPGRYTLETIAYDAPSGRASVRTGTLEVSATDEAKFRLSDVVVLRRAEPANGADENRSNPFHVANMIVSPYLGEPIQRSLKQVPFFFTVYVPSGTSTKPKLTIELLRDGRTLAQIPGMLPDADALGRSQFVAALPLEKLPAGSYELKITVSAETASVSRSRSFTILD
jgi:VWFA-related protein